MLHEKGMGCQIINVDLHNNLEAVATMASYASLPALVERDLILYESNIINEYIDDRFPHPRLMLTDPGMRARARLSLYRFEQDLFCHIDAMEQDNPEIAAKARAAIRDNLAILAPMLAKQEFLLGDEYSILDVAIAPLLWRLEHYEIQLPKEAVAVLEFAERLFTRPAFIPATTAAEKAMRKKSTDG